MVYREFSARKNAENFSVEELKTACTECHKRGVKVYAALNTLVYDSEAEKFAECVKSAAECGVDGLIIQDLGAAEIAKRVCPKLPRHASTQMTLNSARPESTRLSSSDSAGRSSGGSCPSNR